MSISERPLILASGSKTRRDMLRRSGLDCAVNAADIDERSIAHELVKTGHAPAQIAQRLADEKALAVARDNPQSLVIGADTVLDLNGEILFKAGSAEEAKSNLQRMKGKSHKLITAVSVVCGQSVLWRHSEAAIMHVRDFEAGFIDAYCAQAKDALTAAAGGYQLENVGVWLFEKIEGDFFTILGLPLLPLLNYLRRDHAVRL